MIIIRLEYFKYDSVRNYTMTDLLPGAQYNMTMVVGATYKDLDKTRSIVRILFFTGRY